MYQFLTESHHKTIIVFFDQYDYLVTLAVKYSPRSSDLVNIIFFGRLKHSSDSNTIINCIIQMYIPWYINVDNIC